MKSSSFIIFFLIVAFRTFALSELDSANAAYARGDYERSASFYEKLLSTGVQGAEIYYNLGNAYYKNRQLGMAILNYEKARKLDPSDEDILFNLHFANQQTEDKIEEAPVFFLDEWKNNLSHLLSEKGWSVLCISLFAIGMILFALFLWSAATLYKKIFFYSGVMMTLLSATSFYLASESYRVATKSDSGIIIKSSVTVHSSPAESGSKLFILHEGTKVKTVQRQQEWVEVKIANGSSGWIPAETILII